MEIFVTIKGREATSKKLATLSVALKDVRVVNRAVSIQLHSWVIDNYDSQGGKVGGWPEIKNKIYAEKKSKAGKEKLLVWSGRLRNSVIPFADEARAGIGSDVIYSRTHDEGLNGVPQRRILPTVEEAAAIAMPVYNFYVERAAKAAQ